MVPVREKLGCSFPVKCPFVYVISANIFGEADGGGLSRQRKQTDISQESYSPVDIPRQAICQTLRAIVLPPRTRKPWRILTSWHAGYPWRSPPATLASRSPPHRDRFRSFCTTLKWEASHLDKIQLSFLLSWKDSAQTCVGNWFSKTIVNKH